MSEFDDPARYTGYVSIMTPVNLGIDCAGCVTFAAALAQRFEALLIGVAAEDYALSEFAGEIGSAVEDAVDDKAEGVLADNLLRAERAFRRAAGTAIATEWRAGVGAPRTFLAEQARAADLVVMARQGNNDASQGRMAISLGGLIMEIGRPVLVVPPKTHRLSSERIVVAWKDSREARKAVLDALPLLKRAEAVTVVAVGGDLEYQSATDVSQYLRRHGVASQPPPRADPKNEVSRQLLDIAESAEAGLIVAGAYGHGRMQERIFGGVTRDFLTKTTIPCLMSH
ncbi:universal stress protein [Bosea sp. PAMC 26642]|uniref:universal stress protein n=1 Tax=Bosea sp. (strain PAMC 26642) TaxID=1792307 RepID=UPI0007704E2C|nr:universal stress protein [Bosea sp. PAMC 26642]AMJ59683.1 hypothetical protein AXW83_04630 [Bosea sp. PAMC 26642]